MLKFFRNIRGKLLNQGKITGYFLYAIGEVLLVVVGILIALQINNWNEDNKREIAEETLVKQLINDLSKDVESLETIIPRLETKTEVAKQIYLEIQGEASYDQSTMYGDLTWQAFAPLLFEERHQGSPDLISDASISKSILDYFNQEKITETQIQQGNEFIINTVRPYLGIAGVMNSSRVMAVDSYLEISNDKSEFIKYEELKKLYGKIEFESIIFDLRMVHLGTTYQINQLLESNRKLAQKLKDYITED